MSGARRGAEAGGRRRRLRAAVRLAAALGWIVAVLAALFAHRPPPLPWPGG